MNIIYSELIPSSFVKKAIKRPYETGHGEAKLYLTKDYSASQYVEFFNNYSDTNVYFFNKENLAEYMNNFKIVNEYKRKSKYHERYWNSYVCSIKSLPENILFKLEKRFDIDEQRRYYIRSYDYIFREFFRSIALPDLTYIKITKFFNQNLNITYYIFTLEVY
ncbi:hypothetical protein [Clostridium beijerinckii]|uniref:hypothetical protein n=1 Tax=Clostridium beijerinckii TaxID=1520 RepID=UPI0002EE8CE7|nr:hypothetical protein [Clostridium beijerinckii]